MTPADHSAHASIEACATCAQTRRCMVCFEELVRRFQPALLQYVMRRTHSRHDAEDLVQETFLQAYRKLETYESTWRFSTWLYTIGHRLTITSWRRRQMQPMDGEQTEFIASTSESDPLHVLGNRELRSSLWDTAKEVLSEDAVAGLWLSYVESMSAEEIGQILGRNANAVRILLHRARARLAEHLAMTELSGGGL